MAQHHLQTPFSEEVIRTLKVGDIVYFDGTLFGIRDLTQIYMFDQHHEPPGELGRDALHPHRPQLEKSWDTMGADLRGDDHQRPDGPLHPGADRDTTAFGR